MAISSQNKSVSFLYSALDNYGGYPFHDLFDVVQPVYGPKDLISAILSFVISKVAVTVSSKESVIVTASNSRDSFGFGIINAPNLCEYGNAVYRSLPLDR